MNRTAIFALVLAAGIGLGHLSASLSGPPPQGRPSAQDPRYREFDFWVGSWECQTPSGQKAGENVIEKICGDFVLLENWKSATGSVGKSLNMFDVATGRWHQTWADNSGFLLQLDGGLQEDGSMLMEGNRPLPDGSVAFHRIRWRPFDEENQGRVRQTWESSRDGGETWRTQADLVYVPRPEEAADPDAGR